MISKALKRTALTAKGPILLRNILIHTEDSHQTGFEVSDRVREVKKNLRAALKRTGFV